MTELSESSNRWIININLKRKNADSFLTRKLSVQVKEIDREIERRLSQTIKMSLKGNSEWEMGV
jgi:hypothetical protein